MKAKSAIIIVTTYLIIFSLLCATGSFIIIVPYLFVLSPFLIFWMVLSILTDSFDYPELGKHDEWGYLDKAKDELGVF